MFDKEIIIRGDFTLEPMPNNCVKRLRYARISIAYPPTIILTEFSEFEEKKSKERENEKAIITF